jgi:hypothetical protein
MNKFDNPAKFFPYKDQQLVWQKLLPVFGWDD